MSLAPVATRPVARPRHARGVRSAARRSVLGVLVASVGAGALILAMAGTVVAAPWQDPWRPASPVGVAPAPLGTPAPAPAGGGGYRLLHVQDDGTGRPISWDRCRPIRYVVRADGAVPGGPEALAWALARMESVTGLRFVAEGLTDERPAPDRPAADRDRYGDRWSPVLVAWTDAGEYPAIEKYAALGGPVTAGGSGAGTLRYVSGVVLLNREHLAGLSQRPDGQRVLRAVILHELSHVVGLDHVADDGQLMSPQPGVAVFDLGTGDLRGLARLSRGPCFTDF